jgi:signal peptidase I
VFRPPERALKLAGHTDPNTDYVKRCIGLPGDKIELKDGVLYRNDKMVDEPYLRKEPGINSGDFKLVMYKGNLIPIRRRIAEYTNQGSADEYTIDPADYESVWNLPAEKVPQGFYLMLGDNRSGSADSRLWGLVPRDQIVGKVWFVLFSPRRIGLSDAPEG